MSLVASVQCPIIVGRDDLLDLADRRIAQVARGQGHTLFLAGTAGLGKTRLLRACIRKAEAAGLRVDGGSVSPQDQEVPLASIREMAHGMRDNEAFGTLSADLLAIDGRQGGDALGTRRRIVRSMADRILDAVDRPTLLVFDDLHWTDELSLEVIGELARHGGSRPLLVLGGYRADELPAGTIHREWRARLLSQRHAEEARLRPLTLAETGVATTLILGGELPAPRDVVEAIHERTNGIPLHIEELLAALDPVAATDGRQIREAHVPDTIGDAVLARFARLSEDARLLGRAGAVVGRCFTPDVLAGIVNRPLAELEPAIEELVENAILYPFDYVDRGYYDFRHQLLRDAIYGSLPPAQLRRFHAQAAEFVMALESASISHASRHYERAGLRPQAFRASLTAADEANRVSARHEAYELYQRAIDNMPTDLPIGDRAELHERFAGAASSIERNAEALAAATTARQLYLEAGRPLDAAGMLLFIASQAARDGSPDEPAATTIQRALLEIEALPAGRDREQLMAWVLSARANDRLVGSALAAARSDAQAARAIALAVGDRETVLDADLTLARIDIVDGQYESGLRDGMRAAREARDAGFEAVGVTGFRNLAILAARIMDGPAAEVALAEGLQYADAIEQSHCRQMMATTVALLDWAGGRWAVADERARQDLVDRGCRRGVIGALDVIGLVAMGRGQADEARRWLDESLVTGKAFGEVQFIMTPLWALAETALLSGDPYAAVARCEEAWSIAVATGERALLIPFVVTGTRSYLAARRPDGAATWLARLREHLAGWEPLAAGALSHAEGLHRLALGSLAAAREALERAIRGWDQRDRIWERTWASLDLAQVLLRMNRHAEAADVLARARATAEALGSEPLLERARELARAGRGRLTVDEAWWPLTAREFEVARLIAEGLTNAAIADHLSIAPKTASAHVEHILAKLGVARRAEIAAWSATVSRPAAGAARSGGEVEVTTRR